MLAEALRLADVRLVADEPVPGLHPTRSARLVASAPGGAVGTADVPGAAGTVGTPGAAGADGLGADAPGGLVTFGAVGEVDPAVACRFGLGLGRVGWLEVDLGLAHAV